METILVLIHTEADGAVAQPAREAVGVAKSIAQDLGGATFIIGLLGAETQTAAKTLAQSGAERFLAVSGPDFGTARYATDALAAEALARAAKATLVIAAGTSRWSRVLPGVTHRLQGRVDTHVSQLEVQDGQLRVSRWFYRQRMEAVLYREQRPWVIVVDPGSQPAWEGSPGEAEVQAVEVPVPESAQRTQVSGVRKPLADAQTIRPEADLLFVAGAGWTKKQADGQTHVPEAEKLILEFLDCARASLGSSKSLVDLGEEGQAILSFLTHMNQIGQTGATPRHAKGLAACCHGEEPHTVGWRFINERRAINLDPNCGWARGKADVLYVGDAFEVMARLNALLA